MTDRVTVAQRSRMMAAVRGVNTLPEIFVRKRLHAAGFRYRLHAGGLSGKPDIVLPRFRTVVFVHGCFWHGHSCPRGKRPTSNLKFWNTKIDGNIRRDRRNRASLRATGWKPVVIWQCALERGVSALIKRLQVLDASAHASPE
ncbi:MAG: DNA mismatch endonuclease Vsr [Gammaproteobacteria bacterium]|nr:DNA mismatch endonuclease Vsr [Gammaproteobacteria bacterium]